MAIKISAKPPINVAILPNISFIFLPICSPEKVKIKLVIEKITEAIKQLLVKVFNPIPTEKLSKLTEKAKISI